MWIMLNNAFLSIVSKDCGPDELLVRSRVAGHIEAVFHDAVVRRTPGNDYLFRAVVKRSVVANRLAEVASSVDYPNFKDSVDDDALHRAYSAVWGVMARTQEVPPYSRERSGPSLF